MTDNSEPEGVVATSGLLTLEPPAMFPSWVTVGGVSVKLFADGTWSGDRDAFIKALVDAKQAHGDGLTMPVLWLIANALHDEVARRT